jgi:hypothetical protein
VIHIAEPGIPRYSPTLIHSIQRGLPPFTFLLTLTLDGSSPNLESCSALILILIISAKGIRTNHGPWADRSLTEIALRFAVASILFQYEFETNAQSDAAAIEALKQDITTPWRHKLVLSLTPRLGTEEDLDLQGYSIIDAA